MKCAADPDASRDRGRHAGFALHEGFAGGPAAYRYRSAPNSGLQLESKMKNQRLTELLATIRTTLVSSAPEMVRKLRIQAPSYCLFIWYQDTSTDEYAPELGVAPVELRDACLSGNYRDKLGNDAKTSIWLPQQSIAKPFPGYPFPTRFCADLSAASNECYSILLTAEGDYADDGECLMPFRTALHEAARELNAYDWSEILPHADDFIVVAVDYIGYWLVQDMIASIPEKKLAALTARGLIPQEWFQRDVKAEKAAREAEEAAMKRFLQAKADHSRQGKVQEGVECPWCGLSSGWNGEQCSECKYGMK